MCIDRRTITRQLDTLIELKDERLKGVALFSWPK